MVWDMPIKWSNGRQMQVWTQQSCDSEALKLWWVWAVYLWARLQRWAPRQPRLLQLSQTLELTEVCARRRRAPQKAASDHVRGIPSGMRRGMYASPMPLVPRRVARVRGCGLTSSAGASDIPQPGCINDAVPPVDDNIVQACDRPEPPFSPSGERLAAVCDDGGLRILEAA